MDAKPLNLVRPEVPVELAALVAKMMAKEPDRRFQTPGEVAQALVPFFKPASSGALGSKPEVPQAGQPVAREATIVAAPVSPRPIINATPHPLPAAGREPVKTGANGVAWESLIEINDDKPLLEAAKPANLRPKPAGGPIRRPPWVLPTIIAASVIGAVLGIIITIKIKTKNGETKITITAKNSETKITAPDDKYVKGETDQVTVEQTRTGDRPSPITSEKPPEAAPTARSPISPSTKPAIIFTNSIEMKLVLIPAGEFLMGSAEGDVEAEAFEKPQHRVRITRPFYMLTTEVTVGQSGKVFKRNDLVTEANRDGRGAVSWNEERKGWWENPKATWRAPGFDQRDDHPVVIVTWHDAITFCNKLSEIEGLKPCYDLDGRELPDGEGYRLPTEAEWEYACRAGTTTRYYKGDDPETLASVGNIGDGTAKPYLPWVSNTWRDGFVFTAPVGRFSPNAFGLYDMHGNVSEWCSDKYDKIYYAQSPEDDPVCNSQVSERVARGGNFSQLPHVQRSATGAGVTQKPATVI